jgi:hypothetical protein
MNDTGVNAQQLSEADARSVPAADVWAKGFVDSCVMKELKPAEPFLDPQSPVIACGSGLSAMLRSREFAKHAQVLSPRKFGALLPLFDAQPLAVATALGVFDWALRSRGSSPIGENDEAERIRRRLKRAIQQARLVALTFGASEPANSRLCAADVHRDVRKIHQLIRRFSPEGRLLLAIDPSPVAGLSVPASMAIKSTLRAGLEEFLVAEVKDLNQTVFYFPAYELTHDFAHIARRPKPILDIFGVYYTSTGPTAVDAERAYLASRLKTISAVRRAAADIPAQDGPLPA